MGNIQGAGISDATQLFLEETVPIGAMLYKVETLSGNSLVTTCIQMAYKMHLTFVFYSLKGAIEQRLNSIKY